MKKQLSEVFIHSQLEEIRVEAEVKEEVKEGITACADEELDR